MKQLNNWRLYVLALVCASGPLTGCTDEDYKFDEIDGTLGFGGGTLTLPSNNSVNITLDDILDLGNTDLISTDANGDYRFGKDPETVEPVKVKVDPITLSSDRSEAFAFSFTIPDEVMMLPVTTIDCTTLPADVQALLTPSADIEKLEYEFAVPAEVEDLDYVAVGGDKGVALRLNLQMPAIVTKSVITLDLPDMLDIPSGLEEGNVLKVENPTGTQVFEFTVKGISIGDEPSGTAEEYAYLKDGKFQMKGYVNLTLKINELTKPASSAVEVGAGIQMDAIRITSATGLFNPTVSPKTVGSTTVNSLPDFLENRDVVADIDNPQIWLDIESDLPLGGKVEASLTSSTSNKAVLLNEDNGNVLNIAANGTSRLVVCRKAPAGLSGYTPVIASDLSEVICKLAEPMTISVGVTSFEAVQDSPATVELGHEYEFRPAYRFTAPLALGDRAVVIYNKEETGWNGDIKDFQLSKGAIITVTADVQNNVPGDVEVNLSPLGLNGQALAGLTVTPVQNQVAAGEVSRIEYTITDQTGTAFKELDGVEYSIEITAPGKQSMKGVALNKKQTLRISNATVKVEGKFIVNAN